MALLHYLFGLGAGLTLWYFNRRGWIYSDSGSTMEQDVGAIVLPWVAFLAWPLFWACRGLYFAALWARAAWIYANRP